MGTDIARIDPQALIASALEKGSGVETLERLLALAKDVRAEQAKEAFHDAITKFKAECPEIIKSKKAKITSRRTGGTFGYSYAPLDAITSTIDPVLGKNGLSYRWRHRSEGQEVRIACVISHRLGHSEDSGEMAVPISNDDTGASAMQKLGIAVTYGKRYTLLGALGLSPEDDADGAGDDKEKPAQAERTIDVQAEPPQRPTPAMLNTGFGFVSDTVWRGVIEEVKVGWKGKDRNGKDSTIWNILGTGGTKFSTFSESFKDIADKFVASGAVCEIFYDTSKKEKNGKTYTNYDIVNIQAFAGDEPPHPASTDPDIPF